MDPIGQHSTSRGVTSLVGIVLLFAIVTAGMASVVMVGSTALADTQQEVDTDLSVKMFQTVDGQVRALRKSPTAASGSVAIPNQLSGNVVVDPDAASLNVTAHQNGTVTTCTDSPIEIGTMRYERDGEPVAIYQGGAVFKQAESGVSLHGTPHFQYHRGSLQFWLLQFDSEHTASDEIVLDNSLESTRNKTMSLRQDLEDCIRNATTDEDGAPNIGVSVHSEYANGWYRYFSEEHRAENATYDETNQTATAVFDPGTAGDSNLSTDSSSDSNTSVPSVCGTDDKYKDKFKKDNDPDDIVVDGDEFDYRNRSRLEVDCDSGNLTVQYRNRTRAEEDYDEGLRTRFRERNRSKWVYDHDNLTEFRQRNRTHVKIKDKGNATQREQYLNGLNMGINNTDVEHYFFRNRTRYEETDSGVDYRQRVRRIRTGLTGTNNTNTKYRNRTEADGVTMPSFGGPDEILTRQLAEYSGECLKNGWCAGMTDSDGSGSGSTSSVDTQYVSIRILQVSTDE